MGKSRINKRTSRKGMRSGRGLAASMLDKPIFHRLNDKEKMRVLELARMVDPDIFMKGGGMSKKKKGYAKGGAGFAKPHNYFAGGSVTNNLKSK
tara:strand:- start:1130 stop:1411 length:282 start_codon:yes stop_codon:yes gene_type:complete